MMHSGGMCSKAGCRSGRVDGGLYCERHRVELLISLLLGPTVFVAALAATVGVLFAAIVRSLW